MISTKRSSKVEPMYYSSGYPATAEFWEMNMQTRQRRKPLRYKILPSFQQAAIPFETPSNKNPENIGNDSDEKIQARRHLHEIKPGLCIWSSSFQPSRQGEKALAGLRLGHSSYTFIYLRMITTPTVYFMRSNTYGKTSAVIL